MNKIEIIKEYIDDIFKILIGILICMFLISGIINYNIKINESKLDKLRYCHSCGVDLLEK